MLDRAMEHVKSVPYRVTPRWLFYRVFQDGIYCSKGDYHKKFLPLTSKARKRFYGDWRPWTLADDTRELILGGGGFDDPTEWLEVVKEQLKFNKVKWLKQDYSTNVLKNRLITPKQLEQYVRAGLQPVPLPWRALVTTAVTWSLARSEGQSKQWSRGRSNSQMLNKLCPCCRDASDR